MPTKQSNKKTLNFLMNNQRKTKEEKLIDCKEKHKETTNYPVSKALQNTIPSSSGSGNNNTRKQDTKSIIKQKWKEFLYSDTKATPKVCAICLESFSVGDDLCLSYNKECDHVFHKDCIIKWLINHEDCPNCRSTFIVPSIDV